MSAKLTELERALKAVETAAKAVGISLKDVQKAFLDVEGKTKTIKGIRVFGTMEADLAGLKARLPEVAQAYVIALAELEKAHTSQISKVRVTNVSYDEYTKTLKLAATATKDLQVQIREGGKEPVMVPFEIPLEEQVIKMTGGREYTAVQQELINKLGGAERGLKRAEMAAEKYGMSIKDVARAHTDAANGVTRFYWEVKHGEGVTRSASMHVDNMGKILGDTSTRFRSTTAMITRNLVKVIEWAIAVGVVYGAIRKLSQVMEDMRDIEYIFADIAIVTGEVGVALNKYADAALMVARETGIAFKEVLGIYDDVLRSTSNVSDETERLAMATTLLRDATIMSRLANVDLVQGYDMMLAALRQSGLELDQGIVLLDKWVAVSKRAGVSIEDMAQSFAIGADIMRAAGVDIDHFNALTAVLQENTTLSATQVGNALRAMASTYTTERSAQVLNQYGIAVQDLTGEYRSLWEVLQQVAAMYETGVLSESQTKQIAEAMGGGQRRAAQVMTIITNMGRVHEATAVSVNAHGDAEDALTTKTDTLQVALGELTVAWQELSMAIGTEGGILEMMTDLADGMTRVIGGAESLIKILGPLTSALVQFVAIYGIFAYLSAQPRIAGALAGAGAGVAGWAAPRIVRPGYGIIPEEQRPSRGGAMYYRERRPGEQAPFPGAAPPYATGAQATWPGGRQLVSAVTWLQQPQNLVGVFSVAAIAAAPLLADGFTEGAVMRSAGTAIAGGFGWAITSSPVGGMIGAAIGGAILGIIIKRLEAYEKLMTVPVKELTEEELEQRLANQRRILEQAVYGRRETPMAEERQRVIVSAARADIATVEGEMAKRQEIIEEGLYEEKNLYLQQMEEVKAIEEQFARDLPTINQIKLEALKKYSMGEITRKEYNDAVKAAESSTAIIYQFWRQMSEQMSIDITETFDIFRNASQETIDEITAGIAELNSLEVEIIQLEREISLAMDEHPRIQHELNMELARTVTEQERVFEMVKLVMDYMQKGEAAVAPKFMEFDVSKAELVEFIKIAEQMMIEFAAFAGIELALLWEDAAYYALTNEGLWTKIHESTNRQFVQMAMSASEAFEQHFNLDRLRDISPEKFPEIVQRTRYWEDFFKRIGKPLEQEEINLILGPENVWKLLVASQDALRYALQDLTEIEEKRMLEGMWNIPPGATFMVPITSLFYQRQQGEAAPPGGLPPYYPGMEMAGTVTGAGGLTAPAIGSAVARDTRAAFLGDINRIIAALGKPGYGPSEERIAEMQWTAPAVELMQKADAMIMPIISMLEGMMQMSILTPGRQAETEAALAGGWSEIWGKLESGQLDMSGAMTNIETAISSQAMATQTLAESIRTQPVDVDVGPIYGSFEVRNIVYLDGQYIKEYISKVLAQALRRDLRGGVSPGTANAPTTGWLA